MHTAALHLVPILGAEKSKVPFYVAGALLVAWALIVSLGLGLRRPDFPRTGSLERSVIAVTVVLVLAAVSTGVITSGSTPKAGAETGSAQASPKGESTGAAAPPATTSTPAPQPKATTGAPAARPPAPSATTSLKLLANPEGMLTFDTKQLSAKAGSVTIALTNNAPLEHDVTVAQGSTVLAKTPTFRGGSRTLTVKLKPGKYTFYCSVPGHRQAGMEGTLSVS